MSARSKGISSDIDLTDGNVFRHGARPVLEEDSLDHATLPWDSDGKEKPRISINTNGYYSRTWSMTNIALENALTVIDDDYFYEAYEANIDFSSIYGTLNNPRERYDDYAVEEAIERAFNRRVERVRNSTDPETIRIFNLDKIYIRNGRVFHKHEAGAPSLITMPMYSKRQWYNNFIYETAIDSQIWMDNITTSSSKISTITINTGTDITPLYFGSTELTEDEYSGRTMIVGRGDELKRKLALYDYVSVVYEMLQNHSTIENERLVCEDCLRPYIRTPNHGSKSLCPYCSLAMELTMSLDQLTVRKKFSSMSVCEFMRAPLHDDDQDKYQSFADYDQSDWAKEREDKTIDYFFQEVYEDRGVHLIRRPRNSHELRVNISNGEYQDEEEEFSRNSAELTYEKGEIAERDHSLKQFMHISRQLARPVVHNLATVEITSADDDTL